MGFLQLISHAGSGAVPWIVKELNKYGPWCTFVTLGVPTLCVSLFAFRLSETKGTRLSFVGTDVYALKMKVSGLENNSFEIQHEEEQVYRYKKETAV